MAHQSDTRTCLFRCSSSRHCRRTVSEQVGRSISLSVCQSVRQSVSERSREPTRALALACTCLHMPTRCVDRTVVLRVAHHPRRCVCVCVGYAEHPAANQPASYRVETLTHTRSCTHAHTVKQSINHRITSTSTRHIHTDILWRRPRRQGRARVQDTRLVSSPVSRVFTPGFVIVFVYIHTAYYTLHTATATE